MAFYFPPFSISFFLGGTLAVIFAIVVWKRTSVSGSLPFALFALSCAIWAFTAGLGSASVDRSTSIFWSKAEYLGVVTSGTFWLCFALEYSGYHWWRRPVHRFWLWLIPLVTLALVWTEESHHLIWARIFPDPLRPELLIYEHGLWFFVWAACQYGMFAAGLFLLWRYMRRQPGIYRWQIVMLILGTLIPLGGSIIYLLGLDSLKGLDIIPLTFVLAGLIYTITIFRFRFLNVVPIARGILVENMPDGILVLNSSGFVVDINPAVERIAGIQAKIVAGRHLSQAWPELELALSKLDAEKYIELAIDTSGKTVHLEISLTLLKDGKANTIGRLIVLRDITEHRQIEQALRESESRYEALVEQSNEGVLIIQDGVYKYANRTAADITGYPVEEIIGQKLTFLVAGDNQSIILEHYDQLLQGLRTSEIYEVNLKCRDGHIINAELSFGTIRFTGQIATILTLRDITDRIRSQRKIEALYQEERRLSRSLQEEIDKRSKYTRAMVHELRTPLTSVLASSELLESEIDDSILSALVKNIRRSALNLENRINELIELARGEVGLIKIIPAPLDMEMLIREIESEFAPVAAGKGLSLVSEISNLPEVYGDMNRLRQVVSNLVSNSIKFTSRGSIVLSARPLDKDFVVIQVKDTGRGIRPEHLEHLFDPYRRQSWDGQELGGLGIGLALSKMLVDLHHGQIWAENNPGGGAIFSFSLPVYKGAEISLT